MYLTFLYLAKDKKLVKSKITPASDYENITLEVTKPKTKDDNKGIFNSFFDFLPILIMIIIFIVMLAVIIRYKPKERPFADEYEDMIGRPCSEISYKPPLEEFAKPDWQPQVASKDQIPAIGPPTDAAGSQIPQLPPPTAAATIDAPYSESPPLTLAPSPPEEELETLEPELEPDDTGPKVMLPEDIEEEPSFTEPLIVTPEEPVSDEEAKVMENVELPQFGTPLKLETIDPTSKPSEPQTVSEEEPEPEQLGVLPEDLDEVTAKKEPSDTSNEETEPED